MSFLCQLGRGLPAFHGNHALLDEGVVFASITLNGDRDKGGIDDLAALHFSSKVSQRPVQAIKQRGHPLVFLEGFSKGPDRACLGNIGRQIKAEKAQEGESVCLLILQPFI